MPRARRILSASAARRIISLVDAALGCLLITVLRDKSVEICFSTTEDSEVAPHTVVFSWPMVCLACTPVARRIRPIRVCCARCTGPNGVCTYGLLPTVAGAGRFSFTANTIIIIGIDLYDSNHHPQNICLQIHAGRNISNCMTASHASLIVLRYLSNTTRHSWHRENT